MSVIDATLYQEFRQAKKKIYNTLICQLIPPTLFCIVSFFYLLYMFMHYHFVFLIGWLPLLGIHYFFTRYVFQRADVRMRGLVDLYKVQFLNEYGIELRHSPTTVRARFWWDDSGISLICPQRQKQQELQSSMDQDHPIDHSINAPTTITAAATKGGEEGGVFPPIFVSQTMPGDIYIHERSYDPSMKIDKTTWTLLQETHLATVDPERTTLVRTILVLFLLLIAIVMIRVLLLFFFARSVQGTPILIRFVVPGTLIPIVVVGLTCLFFQYADRRNERRWKDFCKEQEKVRTNPSISSSIATTAREEEVVGQATTDSTPGDILPSRRSRVGRTTMTSWTIHQGTYETARVSNPLILVVKILIFVLVVATGFSPILFVIFIYLSTLLRYTDQRNVRLCHEVCQRVNDILKKDYDDTMTMMGPTSQSDDDKTNTTIVTAPLTFAAKKDLLSVEFVSSDLPGRDGRNESRLFRLWAPRRYQFILRTPESDSDEIPPPPDVV